MTQSSMDCFVVPPCNDAIDLHDLTIVGEVESHEIIECIDRLLKSSGLFAGLPLCEEGFEFEHLIFYLFAETLKMVSISLFFVSICFSEVSEEIAMIFIESLQIFATESFGCGDMVLDHFEYG